MKIIENKNNMVIMQDADENITLFSYFSHIATFDRFKNELYISTLWSYSQTTLKQVKHFINNYTSFNYENKKHFEMEIQNNNKIYIIIDD